jgi:transcriptional regulator with XRE-family HTH domain
MVNEIKALLEDKKLSASEFADMIGVQRSSVSHVLSQRNKPSLDFVRKILAAFPELNAEWLITGKGTISKSMNQAILTTGIQGLIPGEPRDKFVKGSIDSKGNQKKKKPPYPVSNEDNISSAIQNPDKRIEKVLILFDDKTFKEYRDPG